MSTSTLERRILKNNAFIHSYGVGAVTFRHYYKREPMSTIILICLRNGIRYILKYKDVKALDAHRKRNGLLEANGWVVCA